jgi:hypothetical protein
MGPTIRRPKGIAVRTALALAAGLALCIVAAAPADAHPVHAYHGSRGHAWTNTNHTRLAAQDTNCDDLHVWAEYRYRTTWVPGIHVVLPRDPDGCGPGYWVDDVDLRDSRYEIRLCVEGRTGCGRWIPMT